MEKVIFDVKLCMDFLLYLSKIYFDYADWRRVSDLMRQ